MELIILYKNNIVQLKNLIKDIIRSTKDQLNVQFLMSITFN